MYRKARFRIYEKKLGGKMEWIDANIELPDEGEVVLTTNRKIVFIGYVHYSEISGASWWLKNPNPDYGDAWITSYKATHWTRDIWPEK